MSKSNAMENGMLLLFFNNTAFAGIGDGGGLQPSATPGSFYVSLHTNDPGEAGDQTTNETAYTGYARQAVARNGSNWVVTGNIVNPAANIDFPECTAAPGTDLTHFGIGTAISGAGILLYKGALTPNVVMNIGTIPRVKSTTAVTEE